MTAKLRHLEIAGRDGNALEEFYAKLFGWKIERQNPGGFDYGMIPSGEAGDLTIGIRHEPEGEYPRSAFRMFRVSRGCRDRLPRASRGFPSRSG